MSTFYNSSNDYRSYLAHHGVKGMKWGRRKQYIRDARYRRKLGRSATIADQSIVYSENRINKIKAKIEKNGIKDKYLKELDNQKWVKRQLTKKRNAYEDALHKQVSKMQKAYGKKIKDVKYDRYDRLSEGVISGKDLAKSIATSVATTAVGAGITVATGGVAGAGLIPGAIAVSIPSETGIRRSDYDNFTRSSLSEESRRIATQRMYEELEKLK